MNQLAVVDRAIQSYKAAMARRLLADKTSEWVSRVQTVADGLNENTTKARTLDGTIPVEEIPHLMCALGYFPTQLEIKNMTNAV